MCESVPGYIVDHIEEITESNINDCNITLNQDNLQFLCHNCHNKKTKRDKRKSRMREIKFDGEARFDENGQLMKTPVVIVHGSPASGKSTFVKENIQDGEIVIDFDSLKTALTFNSEKHSRSKSIGTILTIREGIYSMIEQGKVFADKIYIIAGLPSKAERLELKERLSAELIHIDTPMDECLRRAKQDADRIDKVREEKIIREYWKNFRE